MAEKLKYLGKTIADGNNTANILIKNEERVSVIIHFLIFVFPSSTYQLNNKVNKI
jgi:hypothetical protein